MGTLRIKMVISKGTFKPVEYHLEGVDPTGHADVYYNLGGWAGIANSADLSLKLYCLRKIDFSTMVHDETKNFQTNYSKGTITYYKNPALPIITPAPTSLRCIGLNRVCLLHARENINQASRKKLPHYMLASDLAQFNENVFFDGIWSDNLRQHHRKPIIQDRWFTFILNLFENE
jgi:hypothetical protein